MLVPRRIRPRGWVKVLRLMAASGAISLLLLLTLFSTCPAPPHPGMSQSRAHDQISDQQVRQTSTLPWRYHGALQFMDRDGPNDQQLANYEARLLNDRVGLDQAHQQKDLLKGVDLIVGDSKLPTSGFGRSSLRSDTGIFHFHITGKVDDGSLRADSNRVSRNQTGSQGERDAHHKVKTPNDNNVKLKTPNDNNVKLKTPNDNNVKLKTPNDNNVKLKTPNDNNVKLKKPSLLSARENYRSHSGPTAWRNSTGKPVKRLPTALIIGVKKAGTRALLEFLRAHPDIASPGPEPHFFDRNFHKGLHWYRELMPRTLEHHVTLEKTPAYFVTSQIPQRVYDLDPGMKLLLVVRDPVTRAISDYCQAASKHPVRPFERMALEVNESHAQVRADWSAIRIGLYAQHLAPWLRVFPLHQLHIVDGQELVDRPASELADVETFLGISRFFQDSNFKLRRFKGKFPCLVRQDGSVHCLDGKSKGRDHPAVREEVMDKLRRFYRPHNQRFFYMVGRKFGWS